MVMAAILILNWAFVTHFQLGFGAFAFQVFLGVMWFWLGWAKHKEYMIEKADNYDSKTNEVF